MPNLVQEGIYTQYYNSVVKMAQQTGGVSRPQLMHALAISRTVADGLIARCKLRKSRTDGKTEFFSISRGSKKVLDQPGEEPSKENYMSDANPADPKGLVGAIVGDDQTAPTETPANPKGGKKGGKNRLPVEDQTPTPPVVTEPTAPATAPVVAPTVATTRSAPELDQEIVAIQQAISAASKKSEIAFQTHLAQKAHAEALGDRLRVVLAARLNV